MNIEYADFIGSYPQHTICPKNQKPEYAFIGRSNVGKSSLINMLMGRTGLAKVSGRPGKTQLINHFVVNDEWYLVDLPGYGYAQTSKLNLQKWEAFIADYIIHRENLMNLFVLIDSRLPAQKIDLEFMEWLGEKGIPFSIVFTKTDKLTRSKLNKNLLAYKKEML